MVLAPLQGALFISDTFAANFFEEQLILYTAVSSSVGKAVV